MLFSLALFQVHALDLRYQETFLQANKAYKEGKFQDALVLYKKIPVKESGLYYNMGNAFYKLGQYGKALLYWRRAERLWGIGDKSELVYNIALLKKQVFGKEVRHPFFEYLNI